MAKEKQYLLLLLILPSPSSPTDPSASSPPLDFSYPKFGDSSPRSREIESDNGSNHHLTSTPTSSPLHAPLHQLIRLHLHHLFNHPDHLLRQLTSLLRSSPNLLDLAISQASNLLTSAESTASLASSLSSHVRHLNLAQSRVDSTLSMALASLWRIEPQMAAVRIAPRLCFSSPLLQSASKSTIDFYLSHTPSPSGGAIARSMSSLSSSDASSPAPYSTLSKRATCEREIKKSKFIAIDFSRYLTLGDTRCRHHRLRLRFHSSCLPSDPPDGSSLSSDPPGASPHSSNPIAPIPDPFDASIPASPLFLTPPNSTDVPTQQTSLETHF